LGWVVIYNGMKLANARQLAALEQALARLVIRFLGGFEAVLDGKPAAGFESDKVRALFAYLVMHASRPQRREILTGLLWPDSPESSARASLRNALSNLRQTIGDRHATSPLLCVTRQAITFEEAGDYWLDAAGFNEALLESANSLDCDRPHLEKAISLYRGPLLDGFSVASIPFQEWLLLERERLNRQMVDALRRLTVRYAEEGQLENAFNIAWRQVELEPLEEEGQRLLIRLLAASGRRGEALAQYDRCCQMFRETLDIEPSEETVALHHQILAGEVPAQSSRSPNNLRL
jgi:DNA-binding SARP family transcriptional activator